MNIVETPVDMKYLAPQSWEISLEMNKREYLFLTVTAFSIW